MQLRVCGFRAAAIFAVILLLPLIDCSPADSGSSSAVNAGASSSWSPFHFYSQTLTDGWTIRLRRESDITNYVPTEPSARYLERFYQAVYDKAISGLRNNEAPQYSIHLSLGALSLTLTAGSVPVPWHIIAIFAQSMLNAARRGYVAGYLVAILPPGVTAVESAGSAVMSLSAGLDTRLLRLLAGDRGGDGGWRSPEPVTDDGNDSDADSTYGQSPPCKKHCP